MYIYIDIQYQILLVLFKMPSKNLSHNPCKGVRQVHLNTVKFDPNRYSNNSKDVDKAIILKTSNQRRSNNLNDKKSNVSNSVLLGVSKEMRVKLKNKKSINENHKGKSEVIEAYMNFILERFPKIPQDNWKEKTFIIGLLRNYTVHGNTPNLVMSRFELDSLCCFRCSQILVWKINYGKYTPLQRPTKCSMCLCNCVLYKFHHMCQKCGILYAKCVKCQKSASKIFLQWIENKNTADNETTKDDASDYNQSSIVHSLEDSENESSFSGKHFDEESYSNSDTSFIINNSVNKFDKFIEEESDDDFSFLLGLNARSLKKLKQKYLKVNSIEELHAVKGRTKRTMKKSSKNNNKNQSSSDLCSESDS